MMAEPAKKLITFADLANESQLNEMYGASRTTVGQGKGPRQREIGRLSTEAGEEEPEICSEEAGGGGGGRVT